MAEANYKKVFSGNNEALRIFEEGVAEFVSQFCRNMVSGRDFTLKVEIHGDAGKLIHFRSFDDKFARPSGKQKKV